MKRNAGVSGFTVVELLIVVVLIGILAGVALPRYMFMIERGRAMEGVQILGALREAQFQHLHASGNFTSNSNDLSVSIPSSRFFTFSLLPAPTMNPIAIVKRNTNTLCGNYQLGIGDDGEIHCINGAVGSCCSRFGYAGGGGWPFPWDFVYDD